MKTYSVKIIETLKRNVLIEATNKKEAVEKAKFLIDKGRVTLDVNDDCDGYDFQIIKEYHTTNPPCPRCGHKLIPSDISHYAWQCTECDEDFFDCEI